MNEYEERLATIQELCTTVLNSNQPLLRTSEQLLKSIQHIASVKAIEQYEAIISCEFNHVDSIGIAAISLDYKADKNLLTISKKCKPLDFETGYILAVYFGITELFSLKNNPGVPVVVELSHQGAVEILNGDSVGTLPSQEKKELVWELCRQLPVPIHFRWRPQDSTLGLQRAAKLIEGAK